MVWDHVSCFLINIIIAYVLFLEFAAGPSLVWIPAPLLPSEEAGIQTRVNFVVAKVHKSDIKFKWRSKKLPYHALLVVCGNIVAMAVRYVN